jgi:hypothetical protein
LTVTFNAPGGYQTLDVVNVLINTALDGRQACYLAYSRQSNSLYIVADNGDSSQISGKPMDGLGTVGNSQCTVLLTSSSAIGNGNTLTLTLNLTFATSFGGNKVIYAAARDLSQNNSGWQTMGAHGVPPLPAAFPSPAGMTPSSGNTANQTITFTYKDRTAATNLQTVWALINTAIDGRAACYVAYYRPGNQLYLYPDNGDGNQATNIVLTGNNTISNSQCSISAQGASAQTNGDTLTVTLPFTFKPAFGGYKGVWLAAQTTGGAETSPWQALGAESLPGQAASTPPQITVSRTRLDYQLVTGNQTITVPINVLSDAGSVDFTVALTGDTWVSGSLSPPARTPGVVYIILNSQTRAPGNLTGNLRITPAGGGTPQNVDISLTILAAAAAGGSPQIVALDQDDLLWGRSGPFGLYGQNVDGAKSVTFSPAQGLKADTVASIGSGRVTMNLAIDATAAEGPHTMTVTTGRGTSTPFSFTVRKGQPQIVGLGPAVVNPGRFYSSRRNPLSGDPGVFAFGANGVDLSGITSIQVDPPDGVTALTAPAVPGSLQGVMFISDTAAPGVRRLSAVSPAGRSNELTFEIRSAPATAPIISNLTLNPATASPSTSGGTVTYSGKLDFSDTDGDITAGAKIFLIVDAGLGSEVVTLVTDSGPYLEQGGKHSGTINFSFQKSYTSQVIHVTGTFPVACMIQDAAGNLSNTVRATVSTWDVPSN